MDASGVRTTFRPWIRIHKNLYSNSFLKIKKNIQRKKSIDFGCKINDIGSQNFYFYMNANEIWDLAVYLRIFTVVFVLFLDPAGPIF